MAKLNPDELDPRNNLEWYTSDAITNADVWTPQMIRREYSRLRDIAQKRLKRLAEAEPESYAYRHNVGQYAPARGQTTEELAAKLPELARFIAAKTGTVRGIREQRIKAAETLQSHGYNVSREQMRAFGKWMEQWRTSKEAHSVGSPEIVELFTFAEENEVDKDKIRENYQRWLQHQQKIEEYITKQKSKGKPVTSTDVVARYEKLEAQRLHRNELARERYRRKKEAAASDDDD